MRLGTIKSESSGTSSSASSLELEVSRLAASLRQIKAPVTVTAVDYCRNRARFYSDRYLAWGLSGRLVLMQLLLVVVAGVLSRFCWVKPTISKLLGQAFY
eukprot:gene6846-7064_t